MVGRGAREHALAWALAGSAEVVVTPGNAGMAAHGLAVTARPATELDADLVVIGPEAPLVEGLADELRAAGAAVFGPGADGARLEGSKAYLKGFLAAAGVPSAAYAVVDTAEAAEARLGASRPPYVVKTDGLAAGKGVLVTDSLEAALADAREKLSGRAFGEAGRRLVIEEGLVGEECSVHVLCDGERFATLAVAQDYKRLVDGDRGPNTGGMGGYAPVARIDAATLAAIEDEVVAPTIAELRRRGVDYRGVLYAGMMLTSDGPRLIEYNVRFGDPEAEVLAPLYREGLADVLRSAAEGRLGTVPAPKGAAVTVVLAAAGYPEGPRPGDPIEGLGEDGQLGEPLEGVVVFHAGTARDAAGRFVTAGGRVLAVTGTGPDLATARARAYDGAGRIDFAGCQRRLDVARRAA
ncbi:MAG: phosphoribosylamine--glycine ligase [Actinobacteria bacterium 21-73-9]|nr:MAG: phosphoribosylamine--glycine ligase [Actinobacteria bacterium 21-73-9]